MKGRLLVGVVALALIGSACGSSESGEPIEIDYGRDICVQCGMIISEERFAAGYTVPGDSDRIFDDIGGLILYQRETGETSDPTATWVHDYETSEWVAAADAFFVPTESTTTPMGHGIIAFADRDRAEEFATEVGGEVIGWEIVLQLPDEGGLVGDHDGAGRNDMEDHDMDPGSGSMDG